jgi:hypothetical protein
MVEYGPPAVVANSTTVPEPHPFADIEPVVLGHTLLTIDIVGALGILQVVGLVFIVGELGLTILGSTLQKHLVWIPCTVCV